MAIKDGARIQESTLTSGSGLITLAGADLGFNSIVSSVGTGNQMYYWLLDANGSGWEVGLGTVTSGSPDTFSRDTVIDSSNAGAAISLSVPSGEEKHVIFNAPVPGHVTGNVDFNAQALFNARDLVQSPVIASGVLTLDYRLGGIADVSLTENVTSIVVSNMPAGGAMTVYFKQDATGSRTVDFSGFRTSGSAGLTLSEDANAVDIVALITLDGTSFDAGLFGAAFA